MPRRPLPEAERRAKLLTVRVSETELENLNAAADRRGQTTAEMVRDALRIIAGPDAIGRGRKQEIER